MSASWVCSRICTGCCETLKIKTRFNFILSYLNGKDTQARVRGAVQHVMQPRLRSIGVQTGDRGSEYRHHELNVVVPLDTVIRGGTILQTRSERLGVETVIGKQRNSPRANQKE